MCKKKDKKEKNLLMTFRSGVKKTLQVFSSEYYDFHRQTFSLDYLQATTHFFKQHFYKQG